MAKEMIKVGIANSGETNLELDVLKTWEPKEINYFGPVVYFKHEKTFYSMSIENFKKIYNK